MLNFNESMDMKRLNSFLFTALATLSIVSCTVEIIMEEPEFDSGAPVFTAYVDNVETKTVLDEASNLSKWSGEEYIQVVGKKGTYTFGTSVSGTATSAQFSLNGDSKYNETEVFAVYPHGSATYTGDFTEMSVSNVTVPSNQTPVAGTYDPLAAVAVAHSTNDKLAFKNAVSLLKFTMGSDDIKNVTVYGEMSEVPGGNLPDFVVDGNIYLTIHSDWTSDSPTIAAYFWGGTAKWVTMTEVAGQTNLYTCAVPAGSTNVLFGRIDPGKTPSWDNGSVWNQTVDLNLSDGNHFTITKPWGGQDDKAEGSWETYSATTTAGISGTGTVLYNNGQPVMKGFSEGYVSMTGNFEKGETYYIAVAPVVFEKGFSMQFSRVGDSNKYVVKSTSKRVEFKRNTIHNLGTIVSTGFSTIPAEPDADEECTIYYVPDLDSPLRNYDGDLYAHIWLRSGSEDSHGPTWGDNSSKYKFTKLEDNKWSLTLSPSIRQWFNSGELPIESIGIIARTADKTKQTSDFLIDVVDSKYKIDTTLPEGMKHGINYVDNSTVTLVLYDKDNQGKPHDFCNLLWDENWWGDASKPKTPLYYDPESGCWWITLKNLDQNKQYKFQYQLGYGDNVTVTTFDPYSEIVYDTNNDHGISSTTYPNLSEEFGDNHYGRASGLISAFKIKKDTYNWQVADYKIEDENDLVIYELLFRDFTDNSYGEGSVKAAMEYLDYLKTLGVNAIELMPIQEFEGNISWGYSTHAYFAMDKAYGTRNDYKAFIDACHQKGMAVILDVVYNHATGAHPYAAMYWDGYANKTASNNPWFNVDATHKYSVNHQWNHSNQMVREHVKRNLEYLINEYKVDGFRFDLTKGFTQNSSLIEDYNSERVGYLKEYAYHIECVDPNAVMICEHFVDSENWDLGAAGIKVWRNMNDAYIKSMKRDMSVSDFSGMTQSFDGNSGMQNDNMAFGTLVGYMESHDEERINYAGQWAYDGSSIPFATRIERAKANAAFFLLTPGPKMIWQFGEIGYDISILENDDRTGKKPWKTDEYLAVKERKSLYDTYCMLLKFRKDNPRFFDYDVNFRWYVGGSEQKGRYMFAKSAEGKHFALFGNFGTGTQTISVELPEGVSKWYDYNTGNTWSGRNHNPTMAEGQFYLLVSDPNMCL